MGVSPCPLTGAFSLCVVCLTLVSTTLRNSFYFGLVLGLLLTGYLFFNVTWYHDLLVWSWTNPWLLVPGALVGVAVGVLSDD